MIYTTAELKGIDLVSLPYPSIRTSMKRFELFSLGRRPRMFIAPDSRVTLVDNKHIWFYIVVNDRRASEHDRRPRTVSETLLSMKH